MKSMGDAGMERVWEWWLVHPPLRRLTLDRLVPQQIALEEGAAVLLGENPYNGTSGILAFYVGRYTRSLSC